ncbi:MAG: leucyl aminopeptidase [Erythrobacter sp.]
MTSPKKILLLSLASALAIGAPQAAAAQAVVGSGVAPATQGNSAERPIVFSAQLPAKSDDFDPTAIAQVVMSDDLTGARSVSAIAPAMLKREGFEGNEGQSFTASNGLAADSKIVLFGASPKDDSKPTDWRKVGGRIAQAMSKHKGPVTIMGVPGAREMADVALGASLGQYRFDKYKTNRKPLPTDKLTIVGKAGDLAAARALYNDQYAHLAEGVKFARDLIMEPASVIYPESFIERTKAKFKGVPGVTIEVLDQADMRRLNMGALAGVGQGSPRGARLMLITYKGAGGPPLSLMGKGITFDTGGISIKGNSGMWEMKGDMSGAAAVTGAILSLAKSRAPVHVVATAALAENMPGANAQRPGDVVRTMSGKTIEIFSTDAEGRLVLSDAIEYTVANKKPSAMIDIATLTGSAGRALGPEYAALFARKDAYANAALTASEKTGEGLWRLPLHPAYRKAVRTTELADVRNSGVAPGASSGAHFIEFFVPEDLPWVHIDMAPVDRIEKNTPLIPKGARGFGVMLLDEMARSWKPE